jgi:hypothetical protein
MTMKRKSPWRPHRPSDAAELKPSRFLPGDPVILDDGTSARVEYARSDGMCCLTLPSGKKEWVHEDVLQFAPGFQPTRRR